MPLPNCKKRQDNPPKKTTRDTELNSTEKPSKFEKPKILKRAENKTFYKGYLLFKNTRMLKTGQKAIAHAKW